MENNSYSEENNTLGKIYVVFMAAVGLLTLSREFAIFPILNPMNAVYILSQCSGTF